ncbi:MAG TPA: hypothetical protein VGQ26_30885 [Streptosporangiaceae bacterium]|nr:hypothetical protein [Streptosporangiaceae bacterium]
MTANASTCATLIAAAEHVTPATATIAALTARACEQLVSRPAIPASFGTHNTQI